MQEYFRRFVCTYFEPECSVVIFNGINDFRIVPHVSHIDPSVSVKSGKIAFDDTYVAVIDVIACYRTCNRHNKRKELFHEIIRCKRLSNMGHLSLAEDHSYHEVVWGFLKDVCRHVRVNFLGTAEPDDVESLIEPE